jgi:hypothetical protein
MTLHNTLISLSLGRPLNVHVPHTFEQIKAQRIPNFALYIEISEFSDESSRWNSIRKLPCHRSFDLGSLFLERSQDDGLIAMSLLCSLSDDKIRFDLDGRHRNKIPRIVEYLSHSYLFSDQA